MSDSAKLILGIAGGFFALLLLVLLAGGGGMFGMGPMMYGFDDGHGPWMGGFSSWWMLIPILFWGGLLALIGWAIARIFPKDREGSGEIRPDNAEEVLRERFARGEIDAEEYDRSLRTLRSEDHANYRTNA